MLAEQVRSGLVETVHDGAVAVVDEHGRLIASSGDIERRFYFRSAAKPFQAAVSNRMGAKLEREELAIACASHDGEPVHVALAASILNRAGLDEDDLGCPPSWPLKVTAARRLANQGATKGRRLWHNCSGKHAAMLAACAAADFPTSGYLDPGHPLQVEITAYVSEVAGPVEPIGVDGCGAPVFATNAFGVARAFSRLGNDRDLAPIFSAMHAFPALVSGYGNSDAALATSLDAAAKRGAAGCLGVALRGGYALGIKCWDGNDAVPGVAAVAALLHLGLLPPAIAATLTEVGRPPTRGGGEPVGSFRPVLELGSR